MSPRKIDLINYLKGARFIERPLSAPSCVLDTNVVLDILLFADKNTEPIQKSLASGQLLALGHYDTLYEFADVISRSQFKLTESQIKEKLHAWIKLHWLIKEPLPTEGYCKDHDDDKFFNLARLCSARYLISKDKKVLKAKGKAKRFGCIVIKPENLNL